MRQPSEPLYVCVHIPEFPVQSHVRLRPLLRSKPVAVLEGSAPLEQVCSMNPAASDAGVVRGMTRAEAEELPHVVTVQRSTGEEKQACTALLQTAAAFTPRVQIASRDTGSLNLVLDMSGTGRLLGTMEEIVAKLASVLGEMQFDVKFAASANFHAAVCLASVASSERPCLVKAGHEQAVLGRLSVAVLNLAPNLADTLDAWGLRTLADIAALPEADLVARLGQEGSTLWRLARGKLPHHFVPEESDFSFSELVTFENCIEDLESLLFVLGPMVDQLILRAQQHALALATVTVTYGLEADSQHERALKPALPVIRREVLLRLLHLDLQTHPPSAGVLSVYVRAELGPPSKVQLGLFSPESPEPMRLEVTLARLVNLLGEGRVGSARLLDLHGPIRFTMDAFREVPVENTQWRDAGKFVCTIRRCRPAPRVSMRLQRCRPAAFRLNGRRYLIQRALGPWRTSGAWWSGEVWSSDEWDVCSVRDDGAPFFCIVSQDLFRSQWKLEAVYD